MHIKHTLQHFTLNCQCFMGIDTFIVVSICCKVLKTHLFADLIFLFSVLVTGLMMAYSSRNMWPIVPCTVVVCTYLEKDKYL